MSICPWDRYHILIPLLPLVLASIPGHASVPSVDALCKKLSDRNIGIRVRAAKDLSEHPSKVAANCLYTAVVFPSSKPIGGVKFYFLQEAAIKSLGKMMKHAQEKKKPIGAETALKNITLNSTDLVEAFYADLELRKNGKTALSLAMRTINQDQFDRLKSIYISVLPVTKADEEVAADGLVKWILKCYEAASKEHNRPKQKSAKLLSSDKDIKNALRMVSRRTGANFVRSMIAAGESQLLDFEPGRDLASD